MLRIGGPPIPFVVQRAMMKPLIVHESDETIASILRIELKLQKMFRIAKDGAIIA